MRPKWALSKSQLTAFIDATFDPEYENGGPVAAVFLQSGWFAQFST